MAKFGAGDSGFGDAYKIGLDAARRHGAAYADIRVIREQRESVQVKNGTVEAVSSEQSSGFGIRVLAGGAWGFASSFDYRPDELERVAMDAVAIARASARVGRGRPLELPPLPAVCDSYKAALREDPFEVKLEDRVELLLDADRLMRANKAVRVAQGGVSAMRETQLFASTDGQVIEQEFVETGGGISATCVAAGEMQRRSYPTSFGGDVTQGGFEYVRGLDLPGHAEECAAGAAALLEAPQCPAGQFDIILEGSQLALQIHESCGHPIELDRVFGTEAGYAGTSFLTPEKLGNFRYGSEHVNIVADATAPGGLGTYKYDDEGVPGQRVQIIDRGMFVNYLTSRETAVELAHELGRSPGEFDSNGTMRAEGWNRTPIVRMTNINLEPSDWEFDELVRDTKQGLYLLTNRSWSIDDRRLNFQFGTEVGYEIKDGAIAGMVKNPTYTGITPQFWAGCDAVCGEQHWRLWGLSNCGKGEPVQFAHVGHGASPARFRGVRVGVGQW